jgi:hypothetical protein
MVVDEIMSKVGQSQSILRIACGIVRFAGDEIGDFRASTRARRALEVAGGVEMSLKQNSYSNIRGFDSIVHHFQPVNECFDSPVHCF